MRPTANQIRYLLVIRKLNETKHVIKSVDVAKQLDYSRASIHKMLQALKSSNYVKQEPYGAISITNKGLKTANEYAQKYELVRKKLSSLVDMKSDYNIGICSIIEQMK